MIISTKDKNYQKVYSEYVDNSTKNKIDKTVKLDFESTYVTTTWIAVITLMKEANYVVSLINVAMICDPMRDFCTQNNIPVLYRSAYGTSTI